MALKNRDKRIFSKLLQVSKNTLNLDVPCKNIKGCEWKHMCAFSITPNRLSRLKGSVRQKIDLAALQTIEEHYCFPFQMAVASNLSEILD